MKTFRTIIAAAAVSAAVLCGTTAGASASENARVILPEAEIQLSAGAASGADSAKSLNIDTIKVGDIVTFKGGKHYGTSISIESVGGTRTAGKAKVINIAKNAKHQIALVGEKDGSNVYGWVDLADIEGADTSYTSLELLIGKTVNFKGGKHYGTSISIESAGGTRTAGKAKVINVNAGGKHQIALVGVEGGSNVYGWVDLSDIEETVSVGGTLKVGDKVKVNRGAKTYYGGNLASFVYDKVYSVTEIGKGSYSDYVVIGDGTYIIASLKASDLTKQ